MTCVSMAELERGRVKCLVVFFKVSWRSESISRLSDNDDNESKGTRLSIGGAKVSLINAGIVSDWTESNTRTSVSMMRSGKMTVSEI